jgi:hypothetical protein
MSQCNFANATIDHIRGYGVKLSREDWAGMRLWLQKSAEELEEWARGQALEEAAHVADGCVRDECSPAFIAKRIRERRPTTQSERAMGEGAHLFNDEPCGVCHYVRCVCPR